MGLNQAYVCRCNRISRKVIINSNLKIYKNLYVYIQLIKNYDIKKQDILCAYKHIQTYTNVKVQIKNDISTICILYYHIIYATQTKITQENKAFYLYTSFHDIFPVFSFRNVTPYIYYIWDKNKQIKEANYELSSLAKH